MYWFESEAAGPHGENSGTLRRARLFGQVEARGGARKKIIFIVAGAGYGKSYFAAQLLAGFDRPYFWRQIGFRDQDPVAFITDLVTVLRDRFPEADFPLLQKLIDNGELGAVASARLGELLAAELDRTLPGIHYLVFDDIHLLENSPASLHFLRTLIEAASGNLRFILISRHAILTELQSRALQIGSDDLRLTHDEIAELCVAMLQFPASIEIVRQLHRLTGGWIMGVLLLLKTLPEHDEQAILRRLEELLKQKHPDIHTYFQVEVLALLPEDLRSGFFKLSLLEKVPVALARQLTMVPDIEQHLERAARRNLFVARSDGKRSVYIFHQLLRDSLRAAAGEVLSPQERSQVFRDAAAWFRQQGRVEEAVYYALQAQDYSVAQTLLQKVGLKLLADNRVDTLREMVSQFPEAVVSESNWLSFFHGKLSLEIDPPEAYQSLERARAGFSEEQEFVGEFLATGELIYFHCLVDGMFEQGRCLLARAEELYALLRHELPPIAHFNAARMLSVGFSYVDANANAARARQHAETTRQLAEELDYDNFRVSALLVEIYLHGVQADWGVLRNIVEKLTALAGRPLISEMNRLFVHLNQVNLLGLEGDFDNYPVHRDRLLDDDRAGLSGKTVFLPFLLLWDIDMHFAKGEYVEARRALQLALHGDGAARRPHLRSQYLHYSAYLLALQGDREQAVAAAEESRQLRCAAGGHYFVAFNNMILGGAYVQLGMRGRAEQLLEHARELSTDMGNDFVLAGTHAHRACLCLDCGKQAEALHEIRRMLELLRKNRYVHFFSWTPSVMEKLLSVALAQGIEADYAAFLLSERLGKVRLADGPIVSLLQIRTLGGLELSVGKKTCNHLTAGQRELLALLVATPGCALPLGEIQAALWPDSAEKKSRVKFDNLLFRLRRVLDEHFGAQSSKIYLVLEKGILSLRNVRVDVAEFQDKVKEGLWHARRKKAWQAGNVLRQAHRLWVGEFVPGAQASDRVCDFRRNLHNRYLECVCRLAETHYANGLHEEAVRIAEDGLRYDRTNESLIRLLYEHHARYGNHVQARRTIRDYRDALREDGYVPAEVEEILESFFAEDGM
ncbi:hypothetical protein C2E25_02315 [Geothermobacter hydrogeniphilus]|uniref:Bacterial transcriptional activator domain-containing protein n=1 Tax=Geothermobacter hydrogeniphilus TaxID=1969733 RepID=A0A2K2HDV4_9BACT|nr:BTAD domain-containing putative transcriptional regulator [Geothermobacter hydrogeniphilus]PNU21411.1 hypothetical protein C2E25_02315 [Geothermobacter hydrogeniphilus]